MINHPQETPNWNRHGDSQTGSSARDLAHLAQRSNAVLCEGTEDGQKTTIKLSTGKQSQVSWNTLKLKDKTISHSMKAMKQN